MNTFPYSREQLVSAAKFSESDLEIIKQRRYEYTQLGFGYQLAYVRLLNRFPAQNPLEIYEEILTFVSLQLRIAEQYVTQYEKRQPTISEHQEIIRRYLGFRLFSSAVVEAEAFVFKLSYSLEQTGALTVQLRDFLKKHQILEPSQDTLQRIIQTQRQAARIAIYDQILQALPVAIRQSLDKLLITENSTHSPLHTLKQPPVNPSPAAFNALTTKLEIIQQTGILSVDMTWLNNNFQRSLARYARQCSTFRLQQLKEERRYAVLVCFLSQLYQDTFDAMVEMYDKLVNKIYNRADSEINDFLKKRRRQVRTSLARYKTILDVLLSDNISQADVRQTIFGRIDLQILKAEQEELDTLLSSKYHDAFNRVVARFSYIRQFTPALFKHLQLQAETEDEFSDGLLEAINMLNQMNTEGRYKLPDDAPIDFIPKKLRTMVIQDDRPKKSAWECALLTVVRDQIKSGNLSVQHSKRFATLDTFFIPSSEWATKRKAFFGRSGLPADPGDIAPYLTKRLNHAYDDFLQSLPKNEYAQLDSQGWQITSDPGEKLDSGTDSRLNSLKAWLGQHIRTIKLPDLLIEVDNELQFSRHFMAEADKEHPAAQQVCEILAAIMAHASEIGTYTMAQIIDGISYHRLKQISDWQLHEENQRSSLAKVVNAISNLDITQAWGKGKTSSSDGQRFALRRKVLTQTYSHAFNDFAVEFYSFVADNYAPYFSLLHECADRDAPFVLDGLLYNESDLNIEEHYTDSHGFTDINFAAFAMLGKRFVPRIKGLKNYAIFRVDTEKDYGPLSVLLNKKDRTLHLDWIVEQWDRMGHFYASLECGHVTASTALRRLNGFSGKNHFYRANRELGRLFRTEHTLSFMSDPALRRRNRRGLLKGEQIHALARDIKLGKRGRVNKRDLLEQRHSCSCLTLVMACIIYWQAKEINRVIQDHMPEDDSIDISLIQHISPISWENIILYGDYILNRAKIKLD
ncbi:Tn3 family transposase [Methylotuvimicrobium sp.]|uniref:Tn3 family transposase n=1 Tax=Methylotuvimicrobium sp. TaxID=2822413 RepID=UPI003D65588D